MTIFALSSGQGRSGVAVIRISGPDAKAALSALCHSALPKPRLASLRELKHPKTFELLDRALVLVFDAPSSFTGEDVVELHVHGGRAVLEAVFNALIDVGLRLAEPGEFTRRAFEHGKLDLTEAEGLSDLINADTAAQRRQALAQAGGALRGRYEAWRTELLKAMAYVEASLDFADESDISSDAIDAARAPVESLKADLRAALLDGRRGELIRSGLHIAIIGAPNVGKSSLLNALAGREAAIVFDAPGTTRDVIEVHLDLDGYAFLVRDTAGLREAENAIEQEGIRRALASAADADIVLLLRDGSKGGNIQPLLEFGEGVKDSKIVRLCNKIDIAGVTPQPGELGISATTGRGLGHLKDELVRLARRNLEGAAPLLTRARHRLELEAALGSLINFSHGLDAHAAPELLAQDLREAADALCRLTGRLDVEDVLGQIFSEFCIGK